MQYGSKLPVISLRYGSGLPANCRWHYHDFGQEVLIVTVSSFLNPVQQAAVTQEVKNALRSTTRRDPADTDSQGSLGWFEKPKGWKPPPPKLYGRDPDEDRRP